MSAKSIFWQKMWNTPQNVLPQQTHQCLTRQWYQERKPSSSFSFCKVLVLTNLIGQEEMRLIKYTFLVFSMGQFIWRAIGLLLLPSTRKLKVFLAVKKQMPTIQYNTKLGKTQIAAVVSSVVTFLPLKCLFSSSLTFSESHDCFKRQSTS